jgi:hypothetical protein
MPIPTRTVDVAVRLTFLLSDVGIFLELATIFIAPRRSRARLAKFRRVDQVNIASVQRGFCSGFGFFAVMTMYGQSYEKVMPYDDFYSITVVA